MKKLRVTEEFLWGLYGLLEGIDEASQPFRIRSWRDIVSPEWRELRLRYEKKKRAKTFSQFVSYLKQKGYIKIPTGESIGPLQLTKKGKQKALKGRIKGTKWQDRKDGKMIMLMYDIPKRRQHVRKVFRSTLEFLDYQILQKSVWVSDKDVLEETERAVREHGLGDCVNLFVIEKIRLVKGE